MIEGTGVLLVEDNPTAQLVAKILLQQKGLSVDMASSGKEALEKAYEKKYDFIFMDIGLEEGLDGIMITKNIQKDSPNKDTAVVMLSSNSRELYQERLKDIDIFEYLDKPLTYEKLGSILQTFSA